MIDVIAKRRTTLNGKTYEKGDDVPMSAEQFDALKPIGRFARKPTAKKTSAPKAPNSADRSA